MMPILLPLLVLGWAVPHIIYPTGDEVLLMVSSFWIILWVFAALTPYDRPTSARTQAANFFHRLAAFGLFPLGQVIIYYLYFTR